METKVPTDELELSLDEFEEIKTPVVPAVVLPPANRNKLLDQLRERDAYRRARSQKNP